MSRFRVLCLEIIALYMAGCASGDIIHTGDNISIPHTQSNLYSGFVYNPRDVYEPMTTEFGPILTGTIDLPPCIKNLMNCWEMLNPDVLCKFGTTPWYYTNDFEQVRFDTICMDLRFQCREYNGPQPFPADRSVFFRQRILDLCGQSKFLNQRPWYKYNGNSTLSAGKV